ncbi:MAG: hypothetical protein ACXACC_07655 [Promethearchaeota archaeon]|jgi:hypothetical protein
MIRLNVKCPHHKKSLLDEKNKIDGHLSIHLLYQLDGKNDEILLNSLYGSYNSKIPSSESYRDILTLLCPSCKTSLMSTRVCEKCKAQMVLVNIDEGGNIQICSRVGCKKHILEFEDLNTELKTFYNEYSTFFKGEKQ